MSEGRTPEAIQGGYDAIADAVDPPTRAEVLAFLHGNGPLRGRWYGQKYAGVRPYWWRRYLSVLDASLCVLCGGAPIPMVLHCPSCGAQHIDVPSEGWDNPPHRSHLCGSCGCIWRPADVPTVGVAAVATRGKADNFVRADEPALTHAETAELVDRINADPYLQPGVDLRDEGDLHNPPPLLPACTKKAPPGLRCTRGMGHEGSCAAVPYGDAGDYCAHA